jgi:hypothetical protein
MQNSIYIVKEVSMYRFEKKSPCRNQNRPTRLRLVQFNCGGNSDSGGWGKMMK